MVFFLCSYCGESAKKNAVEKHFNTNCRGAPILVSCMDCQKDFHGNEYVAHTTCVTELEKYSGKDYVAKTSLNKGQKKQDSWLQIVRSILTTSEYNLNTGVKSIFQKLQNCDNVPRKKAKFENFVANSLRVQKNKANEVWMILEKELEKMKSSKNTTSPNGNPELDDPDNKSDKEVSESQFPTDNNQKSSKKRPFKENGATESTEPVSKKNKNNENGHIGPSEPSESQEINPCPETASDFDWCNVITGYAKDGMCVEKLKKKVLKKHRKTIGETDSTVAGKHEKRFKKYFKKSGLILENNIVKVIECQ